jgi:hypothetical protein
LILSFIITIASLEELPVLKKVIFSVFFGVALISLLLIYSHFSMSGYFWIDTYFNNDSKGKPGTFLLRIFTDKEILKITIKSILIATALLFILRVPKLIIFIDQKLKKIQDEIVGPLWTGYLLTAILIYILFYTNFHEYEIGFFLFAVINNFKYKNKNIGKLSITLLMLAYAGTMTAGYNNVSLEILTGVFSTFLFKWLINKYGLDKYKIVMSICALMIAIFINKKIIHNSYDWWGYSVSGLKNNTYTSNNTKLEGLKLDYETKLILDHTDKYIEKLNEEETIFAYPHIPLFYWLYEKTPPVHTIVQWFDVFPSNKLEPLINELNINKPQLILWLKPPNFVYEGHAKLKKTDLPMESVDSYFLNKINNNDYLIEKVFVLNKSKQEIMEPIRAKFILVNNEGTDLIKELLRLNRINEYNRIKINGDSSVVEVVFKNTDDYNNFTDLTKRIPIDINRYQFIILSHKKEVILHQ